MDRIKSKYDIEEVRAAIVEVAPASQIAGSPILTHDLEPQIYDHDDFLEPLKKFILGAQRSRACACSFTNLTV